MTPGAMGPLERRFALIPLLPVKHQAARRLERQFDWVNSGEFASDA